MDPYERSKIGDALVSVNKKAGEFVVKEVLIMNFWEINIFISFWY